MRRHPSSAGSTGLPARYGFARTAAYSLAAMLAVVVGALALLYPVTAATLVAVSAAAGIGTVVAARARLTERRTPRVLMVRIPFTDLRLEV